MNKCGTYAGWNIHMRLREPVCEPCQAANRTYQAAWRSRGGAGVDHEQWLNQTRHRALSELVRRHRSDFDEILASIREEQDEFGD